MNKTQILDCTLRDGGYINEWKFGIDIIKKTIDSLVNTNIDIIELGFLSDSVSYDKNVTLFSTIHDAIQLIPSEKTTSSFVLMINHGEYDINSLPLSDNSIGIRLAFHKHDLKSAITQSKIILQKGYKLYLQPMVINAYTSNEISYLINLVNQIQPWAVYIVDSFGVLTPNNLVKIVKLFDDSISNSIRIGFHSHNNKQLSLANSIVFIDSLNRNCIIDSSIYGMGRGAGNLNTELIIDYINSINNSSNYHSLQLIDVIDNYYYPQQKQTPWGYSLPFYLSAKYQMHPNYAKYLIDLDTLNIEDVEEILEKINVNDRSSFDLNLIQERYINHQSGKKWDNFKKPNSKIRFKKCLVLILPGESILSAYDELIGYSKINCTIVSVNFIPDNINPDYVFISNTKRINQVKDSGALVIKTSNVDYDFINQEVTRYSELINDLDYVKDNALLMLLKYIKKFEVEHIFIAGLDGYDPSPKQSLSNRDNKYRVVNNLVFKKNRNIEIFLKEYMNHIDLTFITPSKFIKI